MLAWLSRPFVIVLMWVPLGAMAQTAPTAPAAQTAQPAAASEQPLLKAEELDQLLAPIALYSDPLLSQVLIASTYPLEVVQAERWSPRTRTSRAINSRPRSTNRPGMTA
jgi:hypothetical protein